jgi:steroid 5-alpha reductase family enzyme
LQHPGGGKFQCSKLKYLYLSTVCSFRQQIHQKIVTKVSGMTRYLLSCLLVLFSYLPWTLSRRFITPYHHRHRNSPFYRCLFSFQELQDRHVNNVENNGRILSNLRGGQIGDKSIVTSEADNDDSMVMSSLLTTPRFLGFTVSDSFSTVHTSEEDSPWKRNTRVHLSPPGKEWNVESVSNLRSSLGKRMVLMLMTFTSLLWDRKQGTLRMAGMYLLTLIGSCPGFYLFLYFITVGYSLGVTLPILALMMLTWCYQKPIQPCTTIHSGLTMLWGIRSATFFLYREYIGWPQLHTKVVEVDQMASIYSKVFCWIVYSFFYTAMSTPCLYRMTNCKGWSIFGKLAISLQGMGLIIESIADFQKSQFKSIPGNRNQWCNIGLFRYSTYPNYLGELLFWYGNFLAGIASFRRPQHWILPILGISFITIVMRGAIEALGTKQNRKYGNIPDFLEHRRSHGLLGPKVDVLHSSYPRLLLYLGVRDKI